MTAQSEQFTSDLATPGQPAPVGQDARVASRERIACKLRERNNFNDLVELWPSERDEIIAALAAADRVKRPSDFSPNEIADGAMDEPSCDDPVWGRRYRVSPDNAAAVMAERERCLAIVKCRIDLWNKAVREGCHEDCSMSLAEECEDIHAAIRKGANR
jgi:hypothetical protein